MTPLHRITPYITKACLEVIWYPFDTTHTLKKIISHRTMTQVTM